MSWHFAHNSLSRGSYSCTFNDPTRVRSLSVTWLSTYCAYHIGFHEIIVVEISTFLFKYEFLQHYYHFLTDNYKTATTYYITMIIFNQCRYCVLWKLLFLVVCPSKESHYLICVFFSFLNVARKRPTCLSTPSIANIKHAMMLLSAWGMWRAICNHQINHHVPLHLSVPLESREFSFFTPFCS